ncbi:hypothetical protein [Streptomyces sp. NPDC020681]|uniref:hypothetical protein n=1 Tax=Streptomyces sp. NPDC020681 TaxID=3365083 RepID=UPI00378B2D59
MRTSLVHGRCAAVFISLGTLLNLLVRDVDEAFVVPDVLVSVALAVGAALPADRAVPMLGSAFGLASGVFTVAAFSYFARGEVGVGVLLFALICAAMTVLFTWRIGLPGRERPLARPSTIQSR